MPDFPHANLLPRQNLEVWLEAQYENLPGGYALATVHDWSGNQRDFAAVAPQPLYQKVAPGIPKSAFYWDGAMNPLVFPDFVPIKFVLMLSYYALPSFPAGNDGYKGLLSDASQNTLLVGNPGAADFLNLNLTASDPSYGFKSNNRLFAESGQRAPVNSKFQVQTLQSDAGLSLANVQIGQDRNLTNRKWNGSVALFLAYSRVPAQIEIFDIFRYIALEYGLWQESAAGLNVFPFPPEWDSDEAVEGVDILSDAADDGTVSAVIKRGNYWAQNLSFASRRAAELAAVQKFHREHYPFRRFTYRDFMLYPFVERQVRFDLSQNKIAARRAGYDQANYQISLAESAGGSGSSSSSNTVQNYFNDRGGDMTELPEGGQIIEIDGGTA